MKPARDHMRSFFRPSALAVGLVLSACGSETAVGIPVSEARSHSEQREVVPTVLQDATEKEPRQIDLKGTVSREKLTGTVSAFAVLTPIDQENITTITNTVEAPCEPCRGRTMASCLVEMPPGCENLNELRDRLVQLVNSGATPAQMRSAVLYTDSWFPAEPPTDRKFDGDADGMPLEVWIDPSTSSARTVVATLDALDLRRVRVYFRIIALANSADQRAWASAAIAAESQGILEDFLRALIKWRDEQRAVQSGLQLELTSADLDVVVASLDDSSFDRERFDRDRQGDAAAERLKADRALAQTLGVRVAPTWFADGYRLRGAQSAQAIQRVIDRERPGDTPATPRGAGGR